MAKDHSGCVLFPMNKALLGKIEAMMASVCKIQEVFASRIQDPTRTQVCSTKDNAARSKST